METAAKTLSRASTQRVAELGANYEEICNSVSKACLKFQRTESSVRVLPVSKFKPAEDILALYESKGLRHFGENYPQELSEKAKLLPNDINWHFIGAIQTNKIKLIAEVKNLYMIESLSDYVKAKKINDRRQADWMVPQILLQINTSGEEQKSGYSTIDPEKIIEDVQKIINTCDRLKFKGFMTIGSLGQSKKEDGSENQDFKRLVGLKKLVCERLSLKEEEIVLSMGMSSDYEEAVRQGSSEVRIGTNIFGARDYSI